MKERDYISWLRDVLSSCYVGDDTAVVRPGDGDILFTTDLLVEGTHFLPDTDAELVGRKAVAASLSDIAAMGGVPACAVISVCFHRGCGEDVSKKIFLGAKGVADEFDVEIVGGDTTSSEGGLSVCVAALGVPQGEGPVARSGAREGDEILVTGALGGSLRGKHLRFTPRVREAAAIMEAARPSAMIDVSDGLARDIGHIVEESGVGAVLLEESIPVSEDAGIMSAEDGTPALEHALRDGEDYELLMTAPSEEAEKILALRLACGITVIGKMQGEGVRIAGASGDECDLGNPGYEHEW